MAVDLSEEVTGAQRAILQRITEKGGDAHAPYLRDLCEAYAWLTSPAQSHGGELSVKVEK